MTVVTAARPAFTAEELAAYREVVRAPSEAELGPAVRTGASPVYAFVLAWGPLVQATAAVAADDGEPAPVVHLSQEIVLNRPLAAGQRLSTTVKLLGARHHPAGRRLAIRSVLRDEDRTPAVEMLTDLLLVGATTPAPFGELPSLRPRGTRDWTTVVRREVPADLPRRYAEVSGDHNPIHLDREQAQAAGFPDVILHGMCVLALVCEEVIARYAAGDATKVRSVRARFSAPVLPAHALEIHLAPDMASCVVAFRCKTAQGTAVKGGWVTLA